MSHERQRFKCCDKAIMNVLQALKAQPGPVKWNRAQRNLTEKTRQEKKKTETREKNTTITNRWKQIKDHRRRLNTFLLLWRWWCGWWLGILGSLGVCHLSYGIHDKIPDRIVLLLCFLLRQSLIGISDFVVLSCLGACELVWILNDNIFFLVFVAIINSLSSPAHLSFSSLHGMSGCGYYSLCKMIGVIWRKLSVNRHVTS